MAKEPDHRYASCGELAEAARGALAEAASRSAPGCRSTGRRPRWWAARRSWGGYAEAWSDARAGSGALLVLSGPRGIGKTRLAAELAREASGDGATVRYASCVGSDGGRPTLWPAPSRSPAPPCSSSRTSTPPMPPMLEALDSLAGELDEQAATRAGHLPSRAAPRPRSSGSWRLAAADRLRELGPLTADGARADRGASRRRGRRRLPGRDGARGDRGRAASSARGGERVGPCRGEPPPGQRGGARGGGALEPARRGGRGRRQRGRAAARRGARPPLLPRAARRAPETRDVCPFKGLASFEAADADYFFGRERLVAELVARLVGAGFLGIVGPLRQRQVLAAAGRPAAGSGRRRAARQRALAPGADPAGRAPAGRSSAARWARMHADPLATAIDSLAPGERLLLAVDQFEELFTACRSEQERDGLRRRARRSGRRPASSEPSSWSRPGPTSTAAAPPTPRWPSCWAPTTSSSARCKPRSCAAPSSYRPPAPACRSSPSWSTRSSPTSSDEPGGLPLLSTALLELWQKRTRQHARRSPPTQDSGGVHGAVARLAEGAYEPALRAERPVARSILLRLAGRGRRRGGRAPPRPACRARRRAQRGQAGRVLAALTERRLVTVSEGTVEVAHEALLREWPRLREWIAGGQPGPQPAPPPHPVRQRVGRSRPRPERALPRRPPRRRPRLDRRARTRAQRARTRPSSPRAARPPRQETKRVRRTNRRLRGLLIGVAVLLAAAIAGGIYAVVQRGQARDAADQAAGLGGTGEGRGDCPARPAPRRTGARRG